MQDVVTFGFNMLCCTLGFSMGFLWLPSLGEAVFCEMIFGYIDDAKMSASCVSACNCMSPTNNGVAGCGFFIAAIKSNEAYFARSAEEINGIEPPSGNN